ncbi:MAG TPA: NAD(P)-dependent oxidoreductase, partial [Salinimicrobium sp.]|nr:NAD(P)-dependent oxidoreductase [Salinimicrobium sp.]
IFGGTGFIGSALETYLKSKGEEVQSVSRSGNRGSLGIDITNESDFSKIGFVPDVIVNCASIIPAQGKKSSDPHFLKNLFLTNVIGGANIANWAVKHKIPQLINCSTLVVVKKPWPDPLSENAVNLPDGPHVGYCMSKLSQEQIMNQCVAGSATKLLNIRLSAVYGTGMLPNGLIFNLLNNLLSNKEIVLNDANRNTLDFINVVDVNKAIYAIAENGFEAQIMNLASGKPISVMDLAETLKRLTGSSSKILNKETNKPTSKSNIDVDRLKKHIYEVYDDFIPLEEGLKAIVENHKVSEQ